MTPDPTTTTLDWLTEQVADADPQPTAGGYHGNVLLSWATTNGACEVSCCYDDPHEAARKVLEMFMLCTRGPEVVAALKPLANSQVPSGPFWHGSDEVKNARTALAHFPETTDA